MLKTIKNCLNILKHNNELDLSYLHGRMLDKNEFLKSQNVKFEGMIFGFLKYFYSVVRRSSIGLNFFSDYCTVDVIYFATTNNQHKSMVSIVQETRKMGISDLFISLTTKQKLDGQIPIKFSVKDVISSLFLLVIRWMNLARSIDKCENKEILKSKYIDHILKSYIYLSYFSRLLSQCKPKMVFVTNDHNVANRALCAVARSLNIKTAYAQHAAVNSRFPPLDFDYAFLDGMVALNCYKSAAKYNGNISDGKCEVFLCGQQIAQNVKKTISEKVKVGIAVNVTDDYSNVVNFIKDSDLDIVIRYHPLQNNKFIENLNNLHLSHSNVSISNPRLETVGEFLSKINLMISGESSIHLEALLNGVNSGYKSFAVTDSMHDHYGFLAKGLLSPLQIPNLSHKSITKSNLLEVSDRQKILIKEYSESFDTSWFTSEYKLIARNIDAILSKKRFDKFMTSLDSYKDFKCVHRIR